MLYIHAMNKPATLIGIAPQVVVEDVVKTATYYRDVLGFTLIGYFLDPPVYAMVQRDGFQVHFSKSDTGSMSPNEQRRSICTDFMIWVPEIDRFYDEVTARGAEIAEVITLRIYGSREFVIRDCNGFRITVGD